MRAFQFVLLIHLVYSNLLGQSGSDFHPPVKLPMLLSGNFGEIRPDHFHSGIDIKTLGTTGHSVYSIDRGYVSRIKVQAGGYGKSIYISHPGGYTSVYGHLDRYREGIADYVKNVQYSRRSHEVDIYLQEDHFPVAKGELIGYSGNTGNSSGPHLHFEVRKTASQHPTNVLRYGFDITDRVAPRYFSLHLFPAGSNSHVNGSSSKFSSTVVLDKGIYTIPYGTRINASGKIGFGVEVFDYLDGSSSRCGIYTLELFVDHALKFRVRMDEFAFSETRYVNAHIDYGEKVRSGTTVRRLHRLPNDRARIYDYLDGSGEIDVTPGKDHAIRIVATDVAGNSSELGFTVTGAGAPAVPAATVAPASPGAMNNTRRMAFGEAFRFETEDLTLQVPAGALYEDLDFHCSAVAGNGEFLSPLYLVSSHEVPLHLPCTLAIRAEGIDPTLHDRLLLVSPDKKNGISAAGGTYRDGWVTVSLREFGQFAVWLDTIPPEITPLDGQVRGDLSARQSLRFRVTDDLSGIKSCEAYIDNRWALFEYDPKNDLLTHTFDETRIGRGRSHELELYVSDSKGNVNLFHTTFTW